jgi:hypothetical protein
MKFLRVLTCFLGVVTLGVAALPATTLHLAFDREGERLALTQAGVGLRGLGAGSRTLTVQVDGPVELAWLYWTGREIPCVADPASGVCGISREPYKDQALRLDNVPLTGAVLGTEFQPVTGRGPILNIGYGVDVTEKVRAKGTGLLTFTLSDGDRDLNLELDGAGLIVLYTAAEGPRARVLGFHGLDFAYGEDFTPGANEVTEAVTFAHGATKGARQGALALLAGDGQKERRPDRIEVRNNQALIDRLDGSAGSEFDADRFPVNIPGRMLATTVQIFSEAWGRNPDSFLWVAAALWLPLPEPQGCTADVWNGKPEWIGTGIAPGQKVKDTFSQSSRYGQIGNVTLRTALHFQGGGGVLGAAKALIREGAAALLNATDPALEYPYTRSQLIVRVNEALASNDSARMGELAALLREANEAGCE